jgi:hypothetical protein
MPGILLRVRVTGKLSRVHVEMLVIVDVLRQRRRLVRLHAGLAAVPAFEAGA